MTTLSPLREEVKRLIDIALKEDIRSGDISSEACIPEDALIQGKFILKQSGRIAGLPFIADVFHALSDKVEVLLLVAEGSEHPAGTPLATVRGPARAVLAGERVALNLLQHLSGVATTTAKYVEKIAGCKCEVLDTRKTLPGLRHVEKYAVKVGGGVNHRFALDDRYIIKNNHLAFLAMETNTPILEAVKRAKAYRPGVLVEVEVETLDMVKEALESGADIIMLDNMTVPMVKKAVQLIRKRAYVEASGGITLDTARAYAETGVDGISAGALTHSVQALDISLALQNPKKK